MDEIFLGGLAALAALVIIAGTVSFITFYLSNRAYKKNQRTLGQDFRTISDFCELICIIAVCGMLVFVIAMGLLKRCFTR